MQIKNYINGELIAPLSKNYLDVYNPATGEIYAQVPDSDEADINTATQAAQAAFPTWSKTSIDEMHRILAKIADLI